MIPSGVWNLTSDNPKTIYNQSYFPSSKVHYIENDCFFVPYYNLRYIGRSYHTLKQLSFWRTRNSLDHFFKSISKITGASISVLVRYLS